VGFLDQEQHQLLKYRLKNTLVAFYFREKPDWNADQLLKNQYVLILLSLADRLLVRDVTYPIRSEIPKLRGFFGCLLEFLK
jgi:hypothetical protein